MRKAFLLLLILFVISTAAAAEQAALSAKLTRLHVIAASDSDGDQRQKLLVRDALLRETPTLLADGPDGGTLIRRFETAARAALDSLGSDAEVTVTLGRENYDLRRYESFALPAGSYRSLRVVIGPGEGQNWWCVLFPPLCFASSEEFFATAEEAGLTEEEISLITESGTGYVVRFRIVQLVEKLLQFLREL